MNAKKRWVHNNAKNISPEEKLSRELEAAKLEIQNLKELAYKIANRKPPERLPKAVSFEENVSVEKRQADEKIRLAEEMAKANRQVEEARLAEEKRAEMNRLAEEIHKAEEKLKAKQAAYDEWPKEEVVHERKGMGVKKNYANLVLGLLLATCSFGILWAFVSEGSEYRGAMVGLPRAIEAVKTNEVDPIVTASSSPVTQRITALPSVAIISHSEYVRLSADEDKVKDALTQDAINKEKARLRRQELTSLSDLLSENSNKLDAIREKATKKVEDLRKRSKTKSDALRKKGKDNEAEKLLVKTENEVEVLLHKSENEVNKTETVMEETQREIDVLLAEDKLQKARDDGLLRQVTEIKGVPIPQQSALVTASTPQPVRVVPPTQRTWKKGDKTVYIENNSTYRLLIYKVVDGKIGDMPQAGVFPGKVQPYIVDGEICLQLVKIEAKGNSEIGGHEVFKNDRLFWVFDGERLERNDKPSPRLYTALAQAGRL